MIAKSDFVILLVSLSALGGGLYRWQNNNGAVPAVTVPASLQSNVRTPVAGENINASSAVNASTVNAEKQSAKTSSPRIISEPVAPTNIVANTESDNTASANDSVTSSGPLYGEHEVVYGDYLGKIAIDYGTSVSELRRINNLSGSSIFVGQKLQYPLPAN